MSIHETIKTKRTEAMKARDKMRLNTLRGLLAAFTNENVAKKRKPDEMLNDEDVLSVIAHEAKKRRDSIEQFEKGNRGDLAEIEKEELIILDEFLPEQMSEDEVKAVVKEKMDALGVSYPSTGSGQVKANMGQLMGAVMKELKGKADGSVVKKIVDELLH